MEENSNQGKLNWQHTTGRTFAESEDGELLAVATFSDSGDNTVNIDHTYVNPILRGQGVAGQMMDEVANRFRREGLKATATCSYADAWLRKNAESNADIIADQPCDGPSCRADGKH